jgi:hypothetical protein
MANLDDIYQALQNTYQALQMIQFCQDASVGFLRELVALAKKNNPRPKGRVKRSKEKTRRNK